MPLEVIIIGGGIAGLSTALTLAQSGHHIRIYEKAKSFDHEGWGLAISPPARKLLIDWKIDENILQPIEVNVIWGRGLRDGNLLWERDSREARKRLGVDTPAVLIDRADLHSGLRAKLSTYSNVQLYLGITPILVEPRQGRVHIPGEKVDQADLIIGADGIHSITYKSFPQPRLPGFISKPARMPIRIHNCVVDTNIAMSDPVVAEHLQTVDYKDSHGLYSEDKTPPKNPNGSRDVLQGQVLLYLPIRKHAMMNFSSAHLDDAAEHYTGPWTISVTREEFMREAQSEKFAEPLRRMLSGARYFERWTIGIRDCPVTFVHGRAVLVGDSGHPVNPALGAGADLGMEDAASLGVLLETANLGNLHRRLELYNELRYKRCVVLKYKSEDRRPAGTGTSQAMLSRLIPGARIPENSDRMLWLEDPVRRALDALEHEEQRQLFGNGTTRRLTSAIQTICTILCLR